MSKSTILPPAPPPIEPIDLKDALEERYLAYALSTIMHRALPDVRDGLKPVHRRILYAMRELRLDPTGAYKKCAKVVGDVMGNFHPHGDQAIYDAMCRLAQDFAVRYPLVDGQGNFGNIDGDNPAAMRYTESRMTAVAGLLLDGIDEDTVDFRPTYDGSNQEPVVLPANFPNLLANGTTGIAVGMATSIPPHNVDELCAALLHLIKHPNASIDKLVEMVQGPDFPTGGIIVEPREQILEAYKTGRGGFRLRDVLKEWLNHRQVVLVRRSQFRLQKIEHRLEVLDGFLIAYLNIDEVIRIVRFEDDPKARLIERFKLSEVQADAILNLRLKALSKLEEIEIKAEHDRLSKERRDLKSLIKSEEQQWERIADEVKATREAYSKKTTIGKRRSAFADAPVIEIDLGQAMIEKEPITVILSEKGWIRAMKGHQDDLSKLDFKQGDQLMRAIKAFTTDKILLLASNGKVFTLAGDQLPGGRGHGEPVRLMVDLEENHAFVEAWVHTPARKLVVAATSGHGFVVAEDEMIAMTRKGKQILNVSEPDEARVAVPADGDTVAVIGENRRMLLFPLSEVNEMTRGKGVYLQRYKNSALSDVRVFRKADGLTWVDSAGRTHTRPYGELKDWIGERAQAGTKAPDGFPKSNKFGRSF